MGEVTRVTLRYETSFMSLLLEDDLDGVQFEFERQFSKQVVISIDDAVVLIDRDAAKRLVHWIQATILGDDSDGTA